MKRGAHQEPPLVVRFPDGTVLTKFTDWVLDLPDGREYWYRVDGRPTGVKLNSLHWKVTRSMSNQRNSRRDAEIAALHAIVVATNRSAQAVLTGAKWWVFTSHAMSGEVVFTYRQAEESPGGGWVMISPDATKGFQYRLLVDGGHEVRAGTS